ncbi:MAG: isocitrate/isopropylmalate family dehydrogenase [Gemmatimonadales bacterium]
MAGALMIEQLGHAEAAGDVERAVRATLAAGIRTPDLGGDAGTRDVAADVAARI